MIGYSSVAQYKSWYKTWSPLQQYFAKHFSDFLMQRYCVKVLLETRSHVRRTPIEFISNRQWNWRSHGRSIVSGQLYTTEQQKLSSLVLKTAVFMFHFVKCIHIGYYELVLIQFYSKLSKLLRNHFTTNKMSIMNMFEEPDTLCERLTGTGNCDVRKRKWQRRRSDLNFDVNRTLNIYMVCVITRWLTARHVTCHIF